ncbi:LPD38 domain-containing protein [Lonepinella koalarum]|uniref:LPD38 domain-containing protein n=1 Tax=Lonepinella koalarum TaxID=53417 RepID=UPI003F6DC99F
MEKTLGLSKKRLGETTRSSDNVLIRKQGGEYFEYGLPPAVIQAIQRENVEQSNSFMRAVSKPLGWFASGVTQWNITFAPVNMMRDVWEKSEFIRIQKVFDKNGNLLDSQQMDKIARTFLNNAVNPSKGIWQATKRFGFNQTLRDSQPSEKLLKDMLAQGALSTYRTYLETTEKDLVKKLQKENSVVSKKLLQAGEVIAGYNKIFDTVSSLASYQALIEHGVDPKQAAGITLELTNFRKTGSVMPFFKALYAFAQPTAMGGRNMMKYLSTPKGQKRFLGYMAVMMPLYMMLRALWDDDEGGNELDKQGDITRYIPIPLPGEKILKIPVGFGMPQLAWNFATNMVKAAVSDISVSEAAVNMFVQSTKSIAPIAPSEISAGKYPLEKAALTFTPTLLQPIAQITLNRNAFGNSITTEYVNKDKLKAEQAKSTTADFWQDLALGIHDTIGVDMHPEQVKNVFDGYSGFVGSLKELSTMFIENPNREKHGLDTRIPFINQLIGTPNQFANASRYYESIHEAANVAREYNSRKERGKLDGWLTDERKDIVTFYELDKKRSAQIRSQKAQLTKALRAGRLSQEAYEQRLRDYHQRSDEYQRVMLNRWRKMQGLNTAE